jgi:hypothetical protein
VLYEPFHSFAATHLRDPKNAELIRKLDALRPDGSIAEEEWDALGT